MLVDAECCALCTDLTLSHRSCAVAKKSKPASNTPKSKPPVPPGWRHSEKFPGYFEVDDLPKPALKQLWVEENMPELIRIQLQVFHLIKLEEEAGRTFKKDAVEALFKGIRLSNGRPISPSHAFWLATNCRPVGEMLGGNKQRKRSNR